jgi:hypothetical protein
LLGESFIIVDASFNFFRFILQITCISGCDIICDIVIDVIMDHTCKGSSSWNFLNEMILFHNVENLFYNLRDFFSNRLCYVDTDLNRSS